MIVTAASDEVVRVQLYVWSVVHLREVVADEEVVVHEGVLLREVVILDVVLYLDECGHGLARMLVAVTVAGVHAGPTCWLFCCACVVSLLAGVQQLDVVVHDVAVLHLDELAHEEVGPCSVVVVAGAW